MRNKIKQLFCALTVVGFGAALYAQESAPTQEQMEKELIETFNKVYLVGTWNSRRGSEVGPAREDKYTIQSIRKGEGDTWYITAQLPINGVPINFPVPVTIKWAGDTPMIQVTDMEFPGMGTYTARLLVYRNDYAGSWYGDGYGGLMSGTIVKQETYDAEHAESTEEGEHSEEEAHEQ